MASRPASAAGDMSLEPLKAWIAEQEEHLRKHGRMAPLTDDQRRALTVLVPRPPSPTARTPDDDKDMGDTDWISLLMRYTQTHKAVHMPPRYDEEQVSRTYSNSPLWRYRCQIREAPDRWFPDIPKEGTPGSVPSDKGLYVRKKEARQYAARSACKWLMANQYMPSDGKSVSFPLGIMRAPAPPALAAAPPATPQQAQPQTLSTKRPYSEMSHKETPPGKQGRPSLFPPPPQTPVSSQSSSQAASQPPSQPHSPSSSLFNLQQQQQQQQQSLRAQQIPPPSSPSLLIPYQGPPSASATAIVAHRTDTASTLGSMYSSLYATANPLSLQARVQSIASWKHPRRRRSDGSSDSGSDTAAGAGPAGREKGTPKPRINSSGHAMPKAKLRDPNAADPEETSYAHRLEMLCRLLNVGTPAYDFKAGNDGAEGIFSGRVTLARGKNSTGPVIVLPPGVGEVRDVYSKKAAREKAAMSVLDYMQSSIAK